MYRWSSLIRNESNFNITVGRNGANEVSSLSLAEVPQSLLPPFPYLELTLLPKLPGGVDHSALVGESFLPMPAGHVALLA